jgi:stringent starvation protein B
VAERSTRPYLIRALYDWALDSGLTPHLAVDATLPGVQVPHSYVQDGRITLNIHPQAVQQLVIGDDGVSFQARFSGVSQLVVVPLPAVLAIFARENGRGMQFPPEEAAASEPPTDKPPATPAPKKGAHLKIIK